MTTVNDILIFPMANDYTLVRTMYCRLRKKFQMIARNNGQKTLRLLMLSRFFPLAALLPMSVEVQFQLP